MLLGLLAALAFAPIYWLAVPQRWRRDVLTIASLIALGFYDYRPIPLLLGICTALFLLMHAAGTARGRARLLPTTFGLTGLAVLFVWNKLGGHGPSVLASQGALVFLGVSYFTLKAAGAL